MMNVWKRTNPFQTTVWSGRAEIQSYVRIRVCAFTLLENVVFRGGTWVLTGLYFIVIFDSNSRVPLYNTWCNSASGNCTRTSIFLSFSLGRADFYHRRSWTLPPFITVKWTITRNHRERLVTELGERNNAIIQLLADSSIPHSLTKTQKKPLYERADRDPSIFPALCLLFCY